MKYLKGLLMVVLVLLVSGCFKKDTMEGITIYTTVYPLSYITNALYGDHAVIKSIYPSEVTVEEYQLTDKQLTDYSKSELYIYNGLSQERDYAITMLNKNNTLKIIDGSMNMEYIYGVEEIWLDPANFLMLAQNIKNGLSAYLTNPYLKNEIEEKYQALKIKLSELDAELSVLARHAQHKTIVVGDKVFEFLSKYGFEVIVLDDEEELNEKQLTTVNALIQAGEVCYIFTSLKHPLRAELQARIIGEVTLQPFHLGINLSVDELTQKSDYFELMYANLEYLKLAVY